MHAELNTCLVIVPTIQLMLKTNVGLMHISSHAQVGDRLGVMRASEFGGSLIFFINGYSIGIVATGVPDNIYGFVELHGDCDTVTITPNSSVELVSQW